MRKRDFEAGLLQEAYTRFKAYYKQQHAPPQAPMVANWFWYLIGFLVAVWICAAAISGIRTNEVFTRISGHAAEGWLAIVVIEGVAGGLPLFGVINRYKREGHVPDDHWISKSMLAIVALAITLGLIINVYSIMLAQHHEISEVTWIVIILAGSVATLTLAVIGHTIGMLYVIGVSETAEAYQAYRVDMADYEQAINEAWEDTRTQKHWMQMVRNEQQGDSVQAVGRVKTNETASGFARLYAEQTPNRQQQTNRQTDRQTDTRNNLTETQAAVWEYLSADPEAAQLSARDLAEKTGVGKDTANKVRNWFVGRN